MALLVLPIVAPSVARADRRNPLEGQPAVRRRVLMRKLRLEVTPQFVTSINQDYKHAFGPGINIQFHLTDWLAVGVQGAYLLNADTALEDKVRSQLPTGEYTYNGGSGTNHGPIPTLGIHDQHVMGINAIFAGYAQITPFYGKIAFFSALFVNYDLYLNGGVGFVNYVQNGCCETVAGASSKTTGLDPNEQSGKLFAGLKIGGQFGIGAHVYFNEWVGLQFELRDYVVGANPGGLDVNGDRLLTKADEGPQNNLFFGVGLTFMLPPHARQTR
ncbi:MAG TPA: outer membrane beta-barrel domain-containing protein [Polyangia bacterium]|jgi:outer membrane beta-barrel protein|nr:outer membrane beta-barrel domain-containing protein [Polyangia bacterium]